MTVRYYEPQLVVIEPPKPGEFRIQTAACLDCSLCGRVIDGMGGPGDAPICEKCYGVLETGQARGAIKWESPTGKE